jgi:2-C-methyl-D-erythritol 4-phosphate cytidylyltransferase
MPSRPRLLLRPPSNNMRYWCVIPAAGAGRRLGAVTPKQYLVLAGATVMQHCLDRIAEVAAFERIVVAIAADDDRARRLSYRAPQRLQFVSGGAERADSVLAGLAALATDAADDDWVLVHDVARPCVRVADIRLLISTAGAHPVGGILANRVRDTMKRGDKRDDILDTVLRDDLWHALTPQMFRYGTLRQALRDALAAGVAITDEASAIERTGLRPCLVEGARDNIKITYPEDLQLAALFLAAQAGESA